MKPAMQAVEIKKMNLLVGSLKNVGGNAGLKFGGAGTSSNIARSHGGDYDGDWGEDEE